jgi:hypothetical protein
MAKSRSACTVLVWKNELAEIWNVTPSRDSVMCSRPSSTCSSVPTATLALRSFTLSSTLAVAGTRAFSAWAIGTSAGTSGALVTTLTIASPVRRPSRSVTKRRSPRSACCSHTESPCARTCRRNSSSSAFIVSDCSRQRSMSRTTSYRSATCRPMAASAPAIVNSILLR